MNTITVCKTALLTLFTTAALTGSSFAQVIYQDDFSGTNAGLLNATTPDVTTGGATWTATPQIKADGSFNYTVDNNVTQYGILAFNPVAGNLYTLSANLTITSQNGLVLFFGKSSPTVTNVFDLPNSTDDTAGIRVDAFGNPATTMNYAYSNKDADGEFTNGVGQQPIGALAQIVLNTTPVNGFWSATFSFNNFVFGTVANIVPGNITNVGFSERWYNTTTPVGAVDNFTLSRAALVPEPSTYAFVLGGLGSLALIRRRLRNG